VPTDTRIVLAALPLAAASLARQRTQAGDWLDEYWLAVQQAVPAPLWTYMVAVDAQMGEGLADAVHDEERQRVWLQAHHPALLDAWKALDHSRELAYIAGSMVQWSVWRLAWHLAHKRQEAGKTKACVYDAMVSHDASMALLGWTNTESTAAWPHPPKFAERWQSHSGDFDPDVLAAAGLHREELELLRCRIA